MYSLFESLKDEKICLAYFGVFSDSITFSLIDLSESYISKNEHFAKISKKASLLIIESFQNIIRHGIIEKNDISEIQYNKDFYQISILDDRIAITSANVIEDNMIENLNQQIDYINSLDVKELKSFQQETLFRGSLSGKGGAGLGLIEMVRKSGLPLKKTIISLTEGFSLLLLGVEISIGTDYKEHRVNIKSTESIYKRLTEDGVLLMYKGDFSSSSNSNLIEMLHANFLRNGAIDSHSLKNIISIIEVIQNVSKHGKALNGMKEGIFAIKNITGELYIECSNFVNREDYDNLKSTLRTIKSKSLQELESLYRQKLANSYPFEEGNGGMGLIEIARLTKNTFTYSFVETEDNEIFYSITIKTF